MSNIKSWQDGWPKVVARAWTDKKFKAALLKDPRKALEKAGIAVPSDCDVEVKEGGKSHKLTIVLPKAPADLGDHNVAHEALKTAAPLHPTKCFC